MLFHKEALDEMKKDYSLVDMHVHTMYSHDSKSPIEWLLKRAKTLGIGLAITDHKRAEGAIEAVRLGKKMGVLVIPGIEIASKENKEILIYFYSAEDLQDYYEKYLKGKSCSSRKPKNGLTKSLTSVRSNLKMNELLELADNYECLKSIPHPYTYLNRSSYMFFAKKKIRPALRRIDAVEVMNSSSRPYMNKRSKGWALRRGLSFTAGSDAHRVSDIGTGVVACRANSVKGVLDSIKGKRNLIIGKEIGPKDAFKCIVYSNKTKRQKDWQSR